MRSLYGTAVVLASATLAFLRPTGIYGPLSKARLALSLDTDPFPASAYHIAPGAQLWDPDTDNTVDKARWVNPFPMPLCSGIHLEEASIDDLQAWMSKGRLTARMLVQCYTSRIRQLNKWTRAVLELNPDALRIADKLDIERYTGKLRGPLHGIPYLIKDNIATRDSMETTAGSYALQGSSVPRDAHLVYLLRQQGAILLGKTNLDEWACMRASFRCQGYSGRGGQTYNVYNFSEHPGGSSGGSAQAIAANMAVFSIGTDTDGSVIVPAARAALVGIRPTLGLISRSGIIPESSHQDTAGVLARSVRDLAIVLSAVAGSDPTDAATSINVRHNHANSQFDLHLVNRSALKGMKLGLPWKSLWSQKPNRDTWHVLLDVLSRIEGAGALLVNGTEFPSAKHTLAQNDWSWQPESYDRSVQFRVDVDFHNEIRDYLSEVEGTNIRNISHLIRYNEDYSDVEGGIPDHIPGFDGQVGLLNSEKTGGIKDDKYWANEAQLPIWARDEGIDAALTSGNDNLDALIAPYAGGTCTLPSIAGYPIITVPAGYDSETDVPIGIAVMGSAWNEPELIRIASAIEDLLRARRTPQFYHYWNRNVIPPGKDSR